MVASLSVPNKQDIYELTDQYSPLLISSDT